MRWEHFRNAESVASNSGSASRGNATRQFVRWLLLPLGVVALIVACTPHQQALPPTSVSQSSQAVSIALLTPPPPSAGANQAPRIVLTMNTGKPLAVEFDTGSNGLRIYQDRLNQSGAAYTDTGIAAYATFGGTRTYYGTSGMVSGINVGGIVIAKPLEFQIVKYVCAGTSTPPPTPSPPAGCANSIGTEETYYGSGVFGVRPEGGPPYNPLAELPGSFSNGFIVSYYGSNPTLTVGLTSSNTAGFSTYPVQTAMQADGAPEWLGNTTFPWCYSINNGPADCASYGVLTDIGSERGTLYVFGSPPPSVPATLAPLPPGTMVTAALGNAYGGSMPFSISWTFTTTGCEFDNDPAFYFSPATPAPGASAPPLSTSGISPYFFNDVLYDLRGGRFGFRAATNAPTTPWPCT